MQKNFNAELPNLTYLDQAQNLDQDLSRLDAETNLPNFICRVKDERYFYDGDTALMRTKRLLGKKNHENTFHLMSTTCACDDEGYARFFIFFQG